MAFMSSLPPNRTDGFRCPYCGKDGFTYIKDGSKRGWSLLHKASDSYHDLEKCQKENDNFSKDNKREKSRIYHAKAASYWKFPYSTAPKEQKELVKQLCSCSEEQIYPTCLIDYKYWFNTAKLDRVIWSYWCGTCGFELTTPQIKQWFSEHDFVKIQEESRIKATWS